MTLTVKQKHSVTLFKPRSEAQSGRVIRKASNLKKVFVSYATPPAL